MEEQSAQPVLMSKVRSRYGRCDYQRFDNLASSHVRAGKGKIGKIEVDCRFAFTKSQWGVIGKSEHPAGIIYLDLDFRQPSDCKLETATVSVTLATDDGEEGAVEARSVCPVKFTDHYGPKTIHGEETLIQTKRTKNRTPYVEGFGYGAGGLGVDKQKVMQTRSRWIFSGHMSSTKGNIWYDTLRWDLQENKVERQPAHNSVVHTAFAFEHNATRFYMTVQVSGRLAKSSDRIKSRLRFGSKDDKDQIVTKFEWAEGYSCPSQLDQIARDLHSVMRLQNLANVPVQVPNAIPATPRPAMMGATPPMHQHSTAQWVESRPVTEAQGVPWRLEASTTQDHLGPTLEDMSIAASLASSSAPSSVSCPAPSSENRRQEKETEADQDSEFSGSMTLVNSVELVRESEETAPEKVPPKIESDTVSGDVVIRLLLVWLRGLSVQVLALMVGIFRVSAETKADALEAAAGKGAVGNPKRLRLTVPQQEPQRYLYEGDTCVSSTGPTPLTGQTANGILKRGQLKSATVDAKGRYPTSFRRESLVNVSR